MGRLVLVEFVTLDGVMQGFGSPDEDTDGGFEHGGWGAQYRDPSQYAAATETRTSTAAYLFGRRTYEKMVGFWPHQGDDNPMAAHLNASPKYVVSSTLRDQDLTWSNARVLHGNLDQRIPALKDRSERDIVVLGSWTLVEHLIQGGHVDEFRLFLHPLLMGTGKRLFRPLPAPLELHLEHCSTTTTGVIVLRYTQPRSADGAALARHAQHASERTR